MRHLRFFLALALLVATLGVVGPAASPAVAMHDGRAVCVDGTQNCAHWGNGYSPPVYSNHAAWSFDWIQDAGYHWQDYGFRQGWNPGAFPAQGDSNCGYGGDYFREGTIVVCWVGNYHAQLYDGGQYHMGATDVTNMGRCDTACNHIYAATIFINYNLSGADRQKVLRHEFGHALGLGHSTEWDSLMHLPINVFSANWDDFYSMYYLMYGDHH